MPVFDLEKETQQVKFVLEKRNLNSVKATVAAVLDTSGSMRNLYNSGKVQEVVQRTFPIALNLDDNGELDTYTFNDGDAFDTVDPPVTRQNFSDFVQKEILDNRNIKKWGGTDYAPVMAAVLEAYGFNKKAGFLGFGGGGYSAESKSKYPALVYLFTDGENSDKSATEAIVKKLQEAKSNVYWMFVGIGDERFGFLQNLADKYNNVGFTRIQDLSKTASMEDFHERLVPDELATWLRGK